MSRFAKYKQSFRLGLSLSFAYRFDFVMNLLSAIFPVIIQVFLWRAIYGQGASGEMYGYTFAQMMIYACMAGVVSKFVATQVEEAINRDIHSGGLGKYLAMPISYLLFRLLYALGEKVLTMLFVLTVSAAVLFAFWLRGLYTPSAPHIALFFPALLLGMLLHFFLLTLISLSAFWLTEVGSFFHAISVVIMVISGGVFPVEIFGGGFTRMMQALPFLYTTGFPIRVITGGIEAAQVWQGLGTQAGWIVVLALLVRVVWRRGTMRYTAVGG